MPIPVGRGPLGVEYVSFTTPFSRVVAATYAAKRKYEPFEAANVTAAMVAPVLTVHVPAFLRGEKAVKEEVVEPEAMVIATPQGTIIRPPSSSRDPQAWSNAFGASKAGQNLTALFPITALAPGNEFRIVFGVLIGEVRLLLTAEMLEEIC
jgi:hypothetical protein